MDALLSLTADLIKILYTASWYRLPGEFAVIEFYIYAIRFLLISRKMNSNDIGCLS